MLPDCDTFDPSFHGDLDGHPWINKMPYRKLGNTGMVTSLLGYGGVSLGNFYGNIEKEEAIETIQMAIKSGVNYIDTSPWYAQSEEVLGAALKNIPRNTYYIGTKVGRYFTPTWENRFDFSSARILKSLETSLERLGLEYVDIIQVHDLEFCLEPEIIWKETIPALHSAVRAGKAKFIGITSYDLELMKKISGIISIDTILSYSRYNFQDMSLSDYVPYFTEKNIGIINASPLAMGLYSSNGPPIWHPASEEIRQNILKADSFLKDNKGKSFQEESLGFSLRPKEEQIATTLVSIPTKAFLEENLKIVSSPVTNDKIELYNEIRNIFGNKNCNWEGKEIEEYKKFIQN